MFLPSVPCDPQDNVFVNQYLIIKDLGAGAHGTVKLVYNTEDDLLYALKARDLGGEERGCVCVFVLRELEICVRYARACGGGACRLTYIYQ